MEKLESKIIVIGVDYSYYHTGSNKMKKICNKLTVYLNSLYARIRLAGGEIIDFPIKDN